MNRSVLCASVSLSLCPVAPAAAAQETTEEAAPAAGQEEEEKVVDLGTTVVSARKWDEDLDKVPFAVTAFTAEQLEQGGILNVREASYLVPNVNIVEFTARRLSFPFIRGIGSGQGEPAVTTYVDGVPQLTTAGTNLPFVDLERVEFLRGPQGTLYGRNSIGGIIHLITPRPNEEPTFDVGVGAGNYDLFDARFGYSGPLGKDVGLTFTGFHSERDGYSTNELTGDRVDSRNGDFGRAQLFIEPGERSELKIGLYGERARDGGFALSFLEPTSFVPGGPPFVGGLRDDPYTINQDFQGEIERDILAPSIDYTYNGDALEVVSISAYQDWDAFESSDFDFSPVDIVVRETNEAQDYFYQEVRVQSPEDAAVRTGEKSELRWLAGLSGFVSDATRSAANDFRVPIGATPPGTDTTSGSFDDSAIALFGNLAWTHNERLEIAGGLRYDYEEKDADLRRTFESGGFTLSDVSSTDDNSFSNVVPMISASYLTGEATRVYGRIAGGFKAGGFNLAAPSGQTSYDPEESTTYEIGVKQEFPEKRVSLRAAVFYIDWDDMQLSLFDPAVGGFVDNAGDSTSTGIELEVGAQATDTVGIFGSLGVLDTEIDEYTDSFGTDTSGNALPYAPENTWSVGAQYGDSNEGGWGWFVRGELVGVGTFYYDAGNRDGDSYELANFRAGMSKGPTRLDFWVRNAFDEAYVPVAFQANPADATSFVGENGVPQVYGVSLRLSF